MKVTPNLQLVVWNTTSRCPLKCKHCYIDGGRANENELSTKEAKLLMDDLSSMGNIMLIFAGGEPQLRPDIYELLSYSNSKGIFSVMLTSGVLINQESVKKLKATGTEWVGISLDSDVADVHDGLRGVPGVFDKAVNAIEMLVKEDISILINMAVFKGNHQLLSRTTEFAERLGVAAIHYLFVTKEGRARDNKDIELSPSEFEKSLAEVYQISKRDLEIMVSPRCAPQFWRVALQRQEDPSFMQLEAWGTATRGCTAGMSVANINPDGEITPCAFWHLPVGNIRDKKFSEVWKESPVFNQLRDLDNLTGKCGLCNYKEVCGGCRERAYSKLGDFLNEDPICMYKPSLSAAQRGL